MYMCERERERERGRARAPEKESVGVVIDIIFKWGWEIMNIQVHLLNFDPL